MSGLEQARLAALARAGERAFLVAEQLALQQRLRERGAVHRHKRAQPPGAGVVDRLGEQFLAGAGLAGDQHCRGSASATLGHRARIGQCGAGAGDEIEAVARRDVTAAPLRTDGAVGALDGGGFAQRQQSAGVEAALANRGTAHQIGAASQLHHHLGLVGLAVDHARQRKLGGDVGQALPDRLGLATIEDLPHRRVDGRDAVAHVNGQDGLVQMRHHRVEVFKTGALADRVFANFDGLLERAIDRAGGVEQHATHAQLLGQADDQAGAHHHLDATALQLQHAVAGFGRRFVGEQFQLDVQQIPNRLQFADCAAIDHQAHLRCHAARRLQGLQQVEAGDVDAGHWQVELRAQQRHVVARADHHINLALLLQLAAPQHGVIESVFIDDDLCTISETPLAAQHQAGQGLVGQHAKAGLALIRENH